MSSSSYQAQFIKIKIKKTGGEHSVFCFYVERTAHVHPKILTVTVGRGILQLLTFNCEIA